MKKWQPFCGGKFVGLLAVNCVVSLIILVIPIDFKCNDDYNPCLVWHV